MRELRWTPQQIEETRDGIGIDSVELTEIEIAVMRVQAREDVIVHLREQDLGTGIVEISKQAMEGACAVGLLRARDDEALSFLETGRALQRVWLTASALALGFQPMTACLFMFRMLRGPAGEVLLNRERQQLER